MGVDDQIIIVETLNRTEAPLTPPKPNEIDKYNKQDIRFGIAMKNSGESITLTSISSVVAFLLGSNIDMPGITAFCIFAALCFLSNYS